MYNLINNSYAKIQEVNKQKGGNLNYSIDVLSAGDVVTDTFIRLKEDQAEVITKGDKKLIAMEFGAKIPYENLFIIEAVGNAGNSSVCCARLGLKSALVTNVGNDSMGRDTIIQLEKNGVDSRFVKINHDKKTNMHYVLWYGSERTILIKPGGYDYHWPHITKMELPNWLYFTSINEHAEDYHQQILAWLIDNPGVNFAFQPGTFQIAMGVHKLRELYSRAQVVILNREEATTVSGGNHGNIHDLMDKMHNLGPKIVVITDGPAGAYASDGQLRLKMPVYPDPGPPVDRTGAGDAFSATFVAALARGQNIEGALMMAPINSMSVVQKVGAREGLLTEDQLQHYLKQAPKNYFPAKFY